MKTKINIITLLLMVATLFVTACQEESIAPVKPGNNQPEYKATAQQLR
ncbi:MAG: hypothetical protein ABJH04_03725 [Cyclobacteriaceae bacterium]